MTDRQLLQQALDALETISEFAGGEGDVCEIIAKRARLAIPALRERLAHCDRCGKKLGGEGDIHTCTPDPIGDAQDRLIAELAAQPEQEPVAWVEVKDTNYGPYEFHGKELLPVGKHDLYAAAQPAQQEPDDEKVDCPRCGHCCPQRQPLTNEQIGKILDDPNIAEKHQGNWLVLPYAYARAIETAHNITGEKK